MFTGINKAALSLKIISNLVNIMIILISSYTICARYTHTRIAFIDSMFATGNSFKGGPEVGVGQQRID